VVDVYTYIIEELENVIAAGAMEKSTALDGGGRISIESARALLAKTYLAAAWDLIYYGLEYKFVTNYLLGKLTFDELFTQLEIAIHQFAKRQMTWFRGMERRGFTIYWLDALKSMDEKLDEIESLLKQ
jgi:tRNA A37 N6-isopentenylltransferase MiaA